MIDRDYHAQMTFYSKLIEKNILWYKKILLIYYFRDIGKKCMYLQMFQVFLVLSLNSYLILFWFSWLEAFFFNCIIILCF